MDYTTLARVKLEAGNDPLVIKSDGLFSMLITSASRWADRYLTGNGTLASANYLLLETITNETLFGQVDKDGNVNCWPHKPVVNTVLAMSWRRDPTYTPIVADPRYFVIDKNCVTAFNQIAMRGRVLVTISYIGGIALTTADIPEDIQEALSVATIRYFRENQTGLTDSMGVAELGTATYTKAIPVRLLNMLIPYKRVVPW